MYQIEIEVDYDGTTGYHPGSHLYRITDTAVDGSVWYDGGYSSSADAKAAALDKLRIITGYRRLPRRHVYRLRVVE